MEDKEKQAFIKITTNKEKKQITPGKAMVDINYSIESQNMSLADMAAVAIYLLENVSKQAQKHGHTVSSMIASAFYVFEQIGLDIEEKIEEAQNGTK